MVMGNQVLAWQFSMHKYLLALSRNSFFSQLVSYGVVGIAINLTGFFIYLLLTWNWLDPKVAISLMYPIGAIMGYLGHSKFSFSYTGSYLSGLLKYVVAHLIGYGTNIVILYIFVDLLGYPHPLIQAIAIFVVAGVLFVQFRYFVFSQKTAR
jgi:putative flippase GtrA